MSLLCEHNDSLEIIEDRSGPSLHCGNHFGQIIQRLESPRNQYPGVAVFCGSTSKHKTLNAVFPKLYPQRRVPAANVQIKLDIRTRSQTSPTIIADIALPPSKPVGSASASKQHFPRCAAYPLKWTAPCGATPFEAVIARLFSSWADAICIFVDDCGGPDAVAKLLRSWAVLGSNTQQPPTAGPHILIVGSHLAETSLQEFPHDDTVSAAFASIQLFDLGKSPNVWTQSDCLKFKERLQQCLHRGRNDRQRRRLLLSAVHQGALFAKALTHISHSLRDPFDIISATRATRTSLQELGHNVQQVLTLARQKYIAPDDVYRVISSALVADALPSGAHAFPPDDVFARLYDQKLLVALSKVHDNYSDAIDACSAIHQLFCEGYEAVIGEAVPAYLYHTRVFRSLRSNWSEMQSTTVCLCCFKSAPEHVLGCGHGYCECCLRIHGIDESSIHGVRDVFRLDVCVVCGKTMTFSARLKPPTAGIRLLSIDGGGIKGIVPLELLASLQTLLGPSCPIQDLFDLCMGTSAGGLIALKVFAQDATLTDATAAFRSLSQEVFQSRDASSSSFFGSLLRILKTVSKDELYDSEVLDGSLLSQFGSKLLFHCNPKSGVQVGVVATAVQGDTSAPARVLATYNGNGTRNKLSGYRLQRAENSQKEVSVWQAARATTAAPGYFRPAITSSGAFQDGCMFHNNPINIALWESRILWPTMGKPDVVLSLGTGLCRTSPTPVSGSPNLSIRDAFPFRVARSFWSSIDGQSIWRDLLNKLDDDSRRDYFRLTVEYPGQEPAMDEFEAMDSLAQAVKTQVDGSPQRRAVLMALLIATFFFELDEAPQAVRGGLLCKGHIRCRTSSAVEALLSLYPDGLELFNGDTSMACWLERADVCQSCHRYGRPVQFIVARLEDVLHLCVKWNGLMQSRYIGAMPRKLGWFMEVQGLNDAFQSPLQLQTPCAQCDRTFEGKRKLGHVSEQMTKHQGSQRYKKQKAA